MAKTVRKSTTPRPDPASGGPDNSSGHPGPSSGKALVIVESPAKAKTINKYLGPRFVVKASMGHVRDLPEKGMGVDTENHFTPTYEILASRKKIIAELKSAAKGCDEIYLATDLDREGEAIAWHLAQRWDLDPLTAKRVVFNEITKTAILNAFQNPRPINESKVNAQQARRILDRLVGYKISPLLWKKVARGIVGGAGAVGGGEAGGGSGAADSGVHSGRVLEADGYFHGGSGACAGTGGGVAEFSGGECGGDGRRAAG